MKQVHWLADKPGEPPIIVTSVLGAKKYRTEGWRVVGPYYHQDDMLPSCVECPECGSEVDTRIARAL